MKPAAIKIAAERGRADQTGPSQDTPGMLAAGARLLAANDLADAQPLAESPN